MPPPALTAPLGWLLTLELRPVLVTDWPVAPRLAWRTLDRQRWLLGDPVGGPGDLPSAVARAGVHEAVLVAVTDGDVRPWTDAGWRIDGRRSTTSAPWRLVVVEH